MCHNIFQLLFNMQNFALDRFSTSLKYVTMIVLMIKQISYMYEKH